MKKLLNKKGFTLMEMLIVVAIIVILVAISVPTFTKQLNKAESAADEANVRAAKACATTYYLMGDGTNDFAVPSGTNTTDRLYDAKAGKLVATDADVEPYGKSTTIPTGDDVHSGCIAPKDAYIRVCIKADGSVTYRWEK